MPRLFAFFTLFDLSFTDFLAELAVDEKRTETMNLFTGRIMKNVVEIIILFVFFPTITPEFVYQLPGKTLSLSVFGLLCFRDPHFQEIRMFVFVRTVGQSLY